MRNMFRRFSAIFLVLATLLGMIPVATFAQDATTSLPSAEATTDYPKNFTLNKTSTPLVDDKVNVTLSVPGTAEGYIDVVFVLGGGMTANMKTIESAIEVFRPVMENGEATVRMGLISLEKGQEIILDLNSDEAVLDPANYIEFVTEKFDSINDLPYGTTNLHSQLVEAQRMLDSEPNAKAENKYIFVLATGRTYWFDDANGEQATIVNKVNGTYYWGNYLWQSQRGRHTSLYMIPDCYNNSYEAFFADIEKWVAEDGDAYVYTPHFDVNDYNAYVTWEQNNNKDLKALGVASSRFGNGIVNPKPTDANFITGVAAGASSSNHPSDALNYERAQYECVQVWKQMVASGYNCYSICSENPNYQNGSEYIVGYGKYTGTSTSQVGHSFMNYLATLAGHDFAPTVWDYERDANGNMISAKTVLQENFFDSVRDDMLYSCSIGSYVEDYIGYDEENGNFEFTLDPALIEMTVGGTLYTTAQVPAKAGADASFVFTAPGATEPTFWLDYYYGDGKTTEKFIWTFGESVSLARPAYLTYELLLTDKSDEGESTRIVDTNISATLYPVDSDGKAGTPLLFPVPQVEYIPESKISISGSKVWVDDENRDGKRPEFITINLIANDTELVDTKNVTAEDNWAFTFSDLPKSKNGQDIVYTISENPVAGYETVVDGYIVTNTHTSELIDIEGSKTWNDDNDRDGKRPESITINLLANGKIIETITVTEEDGWAWSFENLYKYENGKEIVYTITEEKVDGYSTKVEDFNVINSYTPETVTVAGSKTWNDDNDRDGKRPDSITINLLANGKIVETITVTEEDGWAWSFEGLKKFENGGKEIVYTITEEKVDGYETIVSGYNVINVYNPETVIVSGSKTWNDANDQDGLRPDSITINLLANGKIVATKEVSVNDNWAWSFEGLNKFENGGKAIIYSISENPVAGYTTVVSGYNVTNTHTPEKVVVSGSKTWEDNNDQDGKRPVFITINLCANDILVETKNVSAADNWSWSFDNLPKYQNGKMVGYTIVENPVAGYESVVNGYDVTNIYVPEKIDITVNKIWADENDADGLRPDSITINLLANGKIVETKVVTAEDGWTWTITGLDKFQGGEEIVYTVTELAVEGYVTTIDGFTITNTHEVETIIEEPDVPLTDPKDPEDTTDEPDDPLVDIEDPEVPKTSDSTLLWLVAAVISGGFFTITLKSRKKASARR